jgi:hypothetical protein
LQQETFKEAHKEGAQLDTVVVVEGVKGEQPAAGDGSKSEELVYVDGWRFCFVSRLVY